MEQSTEFYSKFPDLVSWDQQTILTKQKTIDDQAFKYFLQSKTQTNVSFEFSLRDLRTGRFSKD